jgi:gluconolactonase
VALDRGGNIYFSDPGGSSVKNPIGSVYRYDIQTAKVTQLATGLAFPNGVAVAPGGKQLCVGESEKYRILIFDLTPEGKLTNRRVLIDFPTETRGPIIGGATPPDGMIFDTAGRLYVAMYTGGVINVVEVPSGKLLRQYKAGGDRATNCHFRKGYLYVTVAAKEAVFRLKLGVEGYDYAGTSGPALGQQKKTYPTIGTIQRLAPRFDKLIPRDAVLEKLAEGFEWTEGPVWVPKGGLLLFSDIPNNSVMKWKEGEGVSLFLKPSGYTGKEERGGEPGSNGLLLDAQGQLVLCQHGDRRLARLKRDGPFTTLADRYQGKRFNSPNDAVFKSNGDLYFTDPPYGLAKGPDDPARELDFCGVYRLSADGKLTLLTDKLTRPNGIGFSPDEKTLYVAQSDPERAVWMAFEVKDDGTLGRQRVFYDATRLVKAGKLKGLPDGLKVDRSGNLFAAGPGGVNVFSPDGTLLGRIDPGEATANCCFGDDGSVVYLTADMYLCRIKTSTKGQGF